MPDLPWFVYAMLLAPLGLILAAAVYKTLQVRAAREWPSAAGKVVVSRAEVRKVKVIDSDRAGGASLRRAQLRRHRLRIFGCGPEAAQQSRQHRRGPRKFPGRRNHREISGRRHRHGLLQSAASGRSGAGARPAQGHVGLSRDRHRDRAGDRVRLGVRPASAHRIRHRPASRAIRKVPPAVVAFGAFGTSDGAVRAGRCTGRRRWRGNGRS